MRVLLGFLALLCVAASAPPPVFQSSRGDIRWVTRFPSAGDGWINDIIRLRNGRTLAVGFVNRIDGDTPSDWRALAVELDGRGHVRRQSEYGEGGGIDAFWTAGQARDRSLMFAGFSSRIGAGGIDALVVHTDARGRQRGEISVGEAAYDRFTGMTPAGDGGWIMVGHSVLPETDNRRVLLVKVDAQGREVWRRMFTEGATSGGLYIAPSGDGAFILSGGATEGDNTDVLVMKVDADGRELWRRVVGAPVTSDVNHGLVVRSDGRIVVVGYTQSWGAVGNDIFAMTLSREGEVLSHSVIGGAGDDHAILARADQEGRIWVVGYTKSAGDGDWDVILAALDDGGAFAPGAAIISGAADDNGAAILPLPGGDLLVGGYSASFGSGHADAFLMRIARPDLSQPDPRFTVRD